MLGQALHLGCSMHRPRSVSCGAQSSTQQTTQVNRPVTAPALSLSSLRRYSYVQQVVNGTEQTVLGNAAEPARISGSSAGQDQVTSTAQQQSQGPLESLKRNVSSLFLPEGYPASVTEDYLPYQLWTVPTHISGSIAHSLTTSSLLQAVGISAGPAATTAASAAIKWILKDGIGAAGRFLVGGRLGTEFDDDPRRWRMVAEALSTVGMALQVATSLYPQHFLVLAGVGNFAMAVGKGVGKPVFRVIQTHFSVNNNIGAVAAKEEVWEVVAQMTGYAASVAVLQTLDGTGTWTDIIAAWAGIQAAHVALRYQALKQLSFATLSHKRLCILASAHVAATATSTSTPSSNNGASSTNSSETPSSKSESDGASASNGSLDVTKGMLVSLPSVSEVNRAEPLLALPESMRPRVHLGCSLQEAFGGSSLPSEETLQAWLAAYAGEQYVLIWRDGIAYVVLHEGYEPRAVLRAFWQAAWLDANANSKGPASPNDTPATVSSSSNVSNTGTSSSSTASSSLPASSSSSSSPSSPSSLLSSSSNGVSSVSFAPASLQEGSGEATVSEVADATPAALQQQPGWPSPEVWESLVALAAQYGGFESALAASGWQLKFLQIKTGAARLRVAAHQQ